MCLYLQRQRTIIIFQALRHHGKPHFMKNFPFHFRFFDFRKSRVMYSYDGSKWYACDKRELCLILLRLNDLKYAYCFDHLTYKGCKFHLFIELQKNNFSNVHIIK